MKNVQVAERHRSKGGYALASKLRVVFKKGIPARHLGHLDVLRTFVRTMRRAHLPIKYSEGFNPHVVMTFALPTGVGVTSECDIADISVVEEISPKIFLEKFNENAPSGLFEIISAEYAETKMPEIVKAEYEIEIFGINDAKPIEDFFALSNIPVEKKSKKKLTEINLAEHIFENSILAVGENSVTVSATISAGNSFNVKPQLVYEAMKNVGGIDTEYATFLRKKFIFA